MLQCVGCIIMYSWITHWSHVFFFFKQKTAYEMRISDWSSDVCSSDLHPARGGGNLPVGLRGRPRCDGRTLQSDARDLRQRSREEGEVHEADRLQRDRKSVV